MYKGVMNARQVDRACARELIRELAAAGMVKEAIEWHRDEYYDLLVEARLCQWQPEPLDDPNAHANTEAFFATYIG